MQQGTRRIAILTLIFLSAGATSSAARALYLLWPVPDALEFCANPRVWGLYLACMSTLFLAGIRYLLGRLKKSAV
jgi:hypothetical protein